VTIDREAFTATDGSGWQERLTEVLCLCSSTSLKGEKELVDDVGFGFEREEDGITRGFDFDDEVDDAWLCNAGDGDFLSFSESLVVINESAINDDEDEARAEGLGA
jgi:hypothetical protein